MKFKILTYLIFTSIFSVNSVQAGIIFQDNFNDNNTDGWSFIGTDNGWNAATGALQSSSTQTSHAGSPGFALIDGIVTPDNFKLEADIKVVGSVAGQNNFDFGHVGFGWGISDINTFNTSYLRTHNNEFTNWKSPYAGELLKVLNFDATNDVSYHFSVEVNYTLQEMTMTLGGVTQFIAGPAFQQYGPYQGGQIGMMTWGERVEYDNIVLSTTNEVPEPSTLAIFALGMIGLASRRFKKQS